MIRKFIESDRNDFISMCKDFYSSAAVLHTVNENNFFNTFDKIISGNPLIHGYTILCGSTIAGYALILPTYSNEAGGLTLWIDEVYIKQEFRNKGLGKELFSFVETNYPNLKRIRLEVTAANMSAIKLYGNLGYINLDYKQMLKEFN